MQEKNIEPLNDSQQASHHPKNQYFYARRMAGMGMMLSAFALVVLVWLFFTQPVFGTAEKAAAVFFVFIFIMNSLQYIRPYVIIGNDYIQMHSRTVPLDRVTRYTADDKFFAVQFHEMQGDKGQMVETAIVVRLNMVKEEDRYKLVFALREAMLKTKAHE